MMNHPVIRHRIARAIDIVIKQTKSKQKKIKFAEHLKLKESNELMTSKYPSRAVVYKYW
jgi:hypothetical protein